MQLTQVKNNLERRGFLTRLFSTAGDAAAYLNQTLDRTTVGIGGSVTVKQTGLFSLLKTHNEVWWHNDEEQLNEYGDAEIRRRAATASAYISSVNGMSEQGELVNIDGRGNRIASTVYGHEKVYFIVGRNKIAESLEKAIWRARNIASPKNAQRLGLQTPCAVKGDRCYDCNSPQRICRGVLILEAPTNGQAVEVLLVDEELGY